MDIYSTFLSPAISFICNTERRFAETVRLHGLTGQMFRDTARLNPVEQTGIKNELSQHFSMSIEKREDLDRTEIEQELRSDGNATGEPAKNKVIAEERREEQQLQKNRRTKEAPAHETIPEVIVSKTEKRLGPVMHDQTRMMKTIHGTKGEAVWDKVDGVFVRMMQKMADEENEMKRGTNSTKSEAEEMEEEKRAVKEDIFRLKPEDQEAPPTNRNSKTCTQSPNPSTSFPLFSHQKVPPSSPEMPFPKDLKLEHEEVKVYLGLLAADKSNFVNPAEPEPHRNMISEAERGEFIFTVQEENPNEPEVTITNLRAKETKATQTPHQNEQGGKFVSSSWKLKPNNTREKTKAIGVDSTHPGKPSRASSALTQINKPSTIPSTTPSSRTMQIDEEHTKKTTKKEKKRRKEDKTQKTPGRRNKSSTPTHFPDFMENYCPLECVCYGR